MNLWNAIRGFFGLPPPMRNKPGGMAYINSLVDEAEGSAALVYRIVKTVRVAHDDFWTIDPPQFYTTTHAAHNVATGMHTMPGDRVMTVAIRDKCLTPLRNPGDEEKDESSAWLPRVPQVTKKRQGETA